MADDFKLHGMDELMGKLDTLEKDLRYRGGRLALRRAANLVMDAAIKNAKSVDDPSTPEDISKNVTIRWDGRHFKRTGDLKFKVGVLVDSKNPPKGGDTWYWRILEFGSINMSARPILRPALEKNTSRSTKEFVTNYKKAIDRALKRKERKERALKMMSTEVPE